jgi:hypothetical protein
MVEIERYPYKDEASAKEWEWFERLNSSLNKNIHNRSRSEIGKDWGDRNQNKILLLYNKYFKTHKESNGMKMIEMVS